MLHRLDRLPAGFLDADARDLHRLLPGPSLVRLPGRSPDALVLSILQHGNEDTGLKAVQQLLAGHGGRPLPRPVWLFIGNPGAAREGHRRLDHQPDLNRCWPGTELADSPETRMTREVIDTMRADPLFASIDIHNTSGENPYHVGVNRLEPRSLQLAALFTHTLVYFTRPRGAHSQAMSAFCPAVTLECGRVGNRFGATDVHRYLERCLRLSELPAEFPDPEEVDLFRSVGVVLVPQHVRVRFGDAADADLVLDAELDQMNFRELPAGTVFGDIHTDGWPVRVLDPEGLEVTERFFEHPDGQLRLRRPVMPSMLTHDPRIIHQDCLCHLMERMPLPSTACPPADR